MCDTGSTSDALQFAGDNRRKQPAPDVPADVREELRKAGAALKALGPSRWQVLAHGADSDGSPSGPGFCGQVAPWFGYLVTQWRAAIDLAKAFDTRPSFTTWCADNGGEVHAVLAFCQEQKPPWAVLFLDEGAVAVHFQGAFRYRDSAGLALLAACRAAGVPTPWRDGTEPGGEAAD
jgi:hypothetical protein